MARARRVSLFQREIRISLSSAALDILYNLAQVLSEGGVDGDAFYGSVMVTIDLSGGKPAALAFCQATRLFSLAESLGGVESLIGYPWSMSHAAFPDKEKRRKGISERTVRLSVGIEHVDDLCEDLDQALQAAANTG